jgi:hypothetical protein
MPRVKGLLDILKMFHQDGLHGFNQMKPHTALACTPLSSHFMRDMLCGESMPMMTSRIADSEFVNTPTTAMVL